MFLALGFNRGRNEVPTTALTHGLCVPKAFGKKTSRWSPVSIGADRSAFSVHVKHSFGASATV